MQINNKFVTILLKMVGSRCNMHCKYCYEHISKKDNKNNKVPNLKEIKEYLSDFFEYKNIFIVFHGGEPLLANFNDVRETLKFIKQNFKYNYKIQFQTNGILLNENWIELMKQYNPQISLSISLDPVGEKYLRYSNNFFNREKIINNLENSLKYIENIGIISVVHKYNYKYFDAFIEEMMGIGVKNFTINKYQSKNINEPGAISELEYIIFLKEIFKKWVHEQWYKKIRIQPLNSLFSKKNRLCIYLADDKKCSYFKTFYNKNNILDFCDHIIDNKLPTIMEKCKKCDIYNFCGGGCLAEIKDDSFCEARKELFYFIEEIKNENKKSYWK